VKSDAETEFVQTQRLPQSKLLLERVFVLTRSTNKVQRERKLSRTRAGFQRNSYEVFHKCELNQKNFEKHESICSISASSCRFGLESTVRPALEITIPRDSAVDKGVAGHPSVTIRDIERYDPLADAVRMRRVRVRSRGNGRGGAHQSSNCNSRPR